MKNFISENWPKMFLITNSVDTWPRWNIHHNHQQLLTLNTLGGDDSEDLHTITVDKCVDGKLGFSVRGGSEHGLSIFVSKVEDNSAAGKINLVSVEINRCSQRCESAQIKHLLCLLLTVFYLCACFQRQQACS